MRVNERAKVHTSNDLNDLGEAWSNKYKSSIDCSHPRGFSQKAHCAARRKRARGEKTKSKPIRESFDPIRYAGQIRKAVEVGWLDNVLDRMVYGLSVGKVIPADPIREVLEENKDKIIKHLLISMRKLDTKRANDVIDMLRKMGIKWTELSIIEKSLAAGIDSSVSENFADGKGPGRPGDSARHSIPKNATLAQLDKIGKGSGRKAQLARWQANMRRGRAKVKENSDLQTLFETIAPHGDPFNELKMMCAGTKPAALVNPWDFDKLYRPVIDGMGWEMIEYEIKGFDGHKFYVVAQPGEKVRANRIVQLVQNANQTVSSGGTLGPDYHRELGFLLGYKKEDIEHFINNLYGDKAVAEGDVVKHVTQKQGAALTVFDIDETLFHTSAKIMVVKDGEVVKELDNRQFNTYILEPGESFDFSQFTDAKLFHDTSVPIETMWTKAKGTLDKIGQRPGSRVIIVTARSDFDDKEMFLNTFRKHGLDIDKIHVHRAGNLNLPSAEGKKKIIRQYLETNQFDMVRLFDDAESNLRSFLSLQSDFPNITFKAYMVMDDGNVAEYRMSQG